MRHFQFSPNDAIIDIRRDKVFKAVFTGDSPNSKAALCSLISAYTGKHVEIITAIANEPPIADLGNRQIRYDIRVKFDNGQLANVEVTLYPGSFEVFRIEYYTSRLHGGQALQGKNYGKLASAWHINFVSTRRLFPDDWFFHQFEYYDRERKISLGGRTHILVVELEKIGMLIQKPVEEMSLEEGWAVFFRYAADPGLRGLINGLMRKEEGIAMAGEMLLTVSEDEIAQARQETALKIELDWQSYMSEAREEGLAEGEAKARQAKLESARRMKEDGFSPEQIQRYTGLFPEDIEAL